MNHRLKIKCPYCGTEFNTFFNDENLAYGNLYRYFQICPDDEIEGACGQVFAITARLEPKLETIFADTVSF